MHLQTFPCSDDFDAFRESEKIWSCDGISKSNNKTTRYFRCNLVKRQGKQCASRLMVVENDCSTEFIAYIAKADHTHDQISNKMCPKLKDRIINLNKNNPTFTAQRIHDIFEAEKLEFIPTREQIQRIITYHCHKDDSDVIISVGDIISWAEEHVCNNNDIDLDTPFVVDFKASSVDDDEKYFQYIVSTKRLLMNASKYLNVCSDATYKVVFHGYPLLMIGSVDADKAFHLIATALSVSETTTDFSFLFEGEAFFQRFNKINLLFFENV